MALDTELCSQITAEGATVANVGSDKQIVYNITAGVTDFEMDAITFKGMPMGFDVDKSMLDTDSLYEKTSEITDAVTDLDEGANTLADGTAALKNGVQSYTDGAVELKNAMDQIQTGSSALTASLPTLKSATQSLADGSVTLLSGAESVNNGAQSVLSGAKVVEQGTDSVLSAAKTIDSGVDSLQSGVASLSDGAQTPASAYDGSDTQTGLSDGTSSLATGMSALNDAVAGMMEDLTAQSESLSQQEAALYESQEAATADVTSSLETYTQSAVYYYSILNQLGDAGIQNLAANNLVTADTVNGMTIYSFQADLDTVNAVLPSSLTQEQYDGFNAFASAYSALTVSLNQSSTYAGLVGAQNAVDSLSTKLTEEGLEINVATLASGADTISKAVNGYTDEQGTVHTGIAEGTKSLLTGIQSVSAGIAGYTAEDGSHVTGLSEGMDSLVAGLEDYTAEDGSHVTGLCEGIVCSQD